MSPAHAGLKIGFYTYEIIKQMTTTELIENLKRFSPDTRVVISGYENNFNDVLNVKKMKLRLNVSEHWYEGAHEESEFDESVSAVALLGENPNAKDF